MVAQPICPCRQQTVAASPTPEKRPARRARGAASWALPSVGLVLLPKCPMCIAAWIAVSSGFSVPLAAAAHVRTALVWLCWGALLFVAIRLLARLAGRPRSRPIGS